MRQVDYTESDSDDLLHELERNMYKIRARNAEIDQIRAEQRRIIKVLEGRGITDPAMLRREER